MNISTRAKALVGAVAIGGAAVAMGGAFTAGGLTQASEVTNDVFIGGQVAQTVEGATLAAIDYTFNNPDDPATITSVALTFDARAVGKTPTITFDEGAPTSCSAVADLTFESTCGPLTQDVGISTVTITVASEGTATPDPA